MSDAPADALAGLQQLARERTERDGLVAQLEVVRARWEETRRRVAATRAELADEEADVVALESVSVTRILAGLRGSRHTDLDRERSEVAAARYLVAEAEARAAAEEREAASLESRIAGLGDLDARRAELLQERERELAADPAAAAASARLAELAERIGTLQARQVQVAEADAAGRQAWNALQEAARHLGSAGSWATYDTFFGGGMVADMVKHDRLDRAQALMHRADAALARLATELADVGIGAVGEVGITEMTRALDVWFDNIFSDWAVRDRIEQAARRVDALSQAVADVGRELVRRREATDEELAAARAERERLLAGDA